jgi:predicted dehydrogenase
MRAKLLSSPSFGGDAKLSISRAGPEGDHKEQKMPGPSHASSPALRLIIAGLGFWGTSWIAAVRELPDWRLVALVDTDDDALARGASAARLQPSLCFSSISDASKAVESDAVLIVVPPARHASLALEALESGLHCLVEKPFASTLEDARMIVERADSARRAVMVSQQYRYRPGARTVARLIDEGVVGRVGAAYVHFSNEPAVHGFQYEMEEPLLWDMAIHHFDLMRGVLGVQPVRVYAASSNPPWSTFRGNASVSATFETEDGVAIAYTGTWAPRARLTGWDGVWDIDCEWGSIRWDGDDVVVRPLAPPLRAKIRRRALRREWRGRRIKTTSIGETDRRGTLAEFSAAIRQQREPETSGRDNIRSLALVVAAIESTRTGSAVDIERLLNADGEVSTRRVRGRGKEA